MHDSQISAANAKAVFEKYAKVKMSKVRSAARTISERRSSWIPPPQRYFKMNVDEVVNRDKHQIGLEI